MTGQNVTGQSICLTCCCHAAGPPPGAAPPVRRPDGAVLTPADLAHCQLLHHGELQELAWLLGLLEDWLLHTDPDIPADLARFDRHHSATELITELGTQSLKLRRLTS